MPWGGSAPNQTYERTDGVRTGAAVCAQAKAASVNDTATLCDTREQDMATALNLVWKRDGGNAPTADLPMNSHKLTGMADGTDATDSVTLGQIQTGNLIYAEAGGTANAITLTTAISFTAAEGVSVEFVAEADSTAAVTVALNGGSALALQYCGAALIGGEIRNLQAHRITHDGTQWQLQNSARLKDIGALAKTDGNIIVGDGTNWVAESGATARTSLGLGTGDSPQFTALNIGNASDTTITRTGAGDIAVEGNGIYRAGGTDVAIADGGTGASTAANAFAALKQAATTAATGVVQFADAAAMEAATAGRAVTADVQHRHPAHPKAGGNFDGTGTPAFASDYGMGAITDLGTGSYTLNTDTAFSSSTDFWVVMSGLSTNGSSNQAVILAESSSSARTTSSVRAEAKNCTTADQVDRSINDVAFWGDYA